TMTLVAVVRKNRTDIPIEFDSVGRAVGSWLGPQCGRARQDANGGKRRWQSNGHMLILPRARSVRYRGVHPLGGLATAASDGPATRAGDTPINGSTPMTSRGVALGPFFDAN